MKIYVGITDNDWFRFLRDRGVSDEVNFWRPLTTREFRTLEPGGLFLFKLHSPENFIVGGGYFGHFTTLPCSLAWEVFGEKNGAASLAEMRGLIERRRDPGIGREDYRIGCILLQVPFFFENSEWFPPPEDFRRGIQQGKTYADDTLAGKRLWQQVQERLGAQPAVREAVGETLGPYRWTRQRLGQGTFRILVTDVYQRRCSVTGEKALPVLEAAHILPVSEKGQNRVDNGLLLRSDVHALFDKGYVTVTPDLEFQASRALKDEFDNGKEYFKFHRRKIWVPDEKELQPNREFLDWHSRNVFRG